MDMDKYFIVKVDKDNVVKFYKTFSILEKKDLFERVKKSQNCEKSQIKIKEIPFSMYHFPSDVLWKMYDKPFKLKMVNRKAVKILEYYGSSAKIQYVKSGIECTVSRTVIKEYVIKKKQK
tara:strand:+ start:89 stop:448 length:360 start_codon:yes stop_codon:yes gene_type:complete